MRRARALVVVVGLLLRPRALVALVGLVGFVGLIGLIGLIGLVACAPVARECAGTLLRVTANACVDVLCDTEDAELVEDAEDGSDGADGDRSGERRAEPRGEPPVPPWQPWQPAPGGCDVVVGEGDDEGVVRVACAGGARAVFAPLAPGEAFAATEPAVLGEERAATAADLCPRASVRLQGRDDDGDGVLAASEVTGRTVACGDQDGVRAPTLQGHLAIHGPEDVIRVAGRRALTGGLVVDSRRLVHLELPELQSVGGSLRVVRAPRLEVLALEALAAVGADVEVHAATRLTRLSLPALARVGGRLVVVDNPHLPQSQAEALVFRLTRRGFSGRVELAGNAVE